jgi:hypothetical protein
MSKGAMRISWWAALLTLPLGLALLGCWNSASKVDPPEEGAGGAVWFEDMTDAVGLDFVQDPGPTGTYFMPQAQGTGCAFIHDPDGTLYLYLLNNAGPKSKSVNRLYKRLPDGKLQDVTANSGLDIAGYNIGVAVGDVNNDGLPDVLVTQFGGVKLFLNKGGGHFEDVTEESGLKNVLWGTSAAFFDYDRDGWLDLILINYINYDPSNPGCPAPEGAPDFCGPLSAPPTCSKLFHNLGSTVGADGKPGARVRFEDVSFASGIGRLPGPGLGVVCADFDGDGWPDIFVANDNAPNRLWINGHDGTFRDEAVSRGCAYTSMGKAYANMGIAVGDTTNDGLLDLYVTHLNDETNTLWKQGPRGRFKDRTVDTNLMATRWRGTGFGTLMADFDLDGFQDIAIVNGGVKRGPAKNTGLGFWEPYAEHNQLLANDGSGKFRDVSAANKPFCGYWNVGRGLACSDYFSEGIPDLLVTGAGDRARLFRNVAPHRGHWLKVRAEDPACHRDAYGAEVRVVAGTRKWYRVINPAQSYLSSGSPAALFGLGDATHIDAILVHWPDRPKDEWQEYPGGDVDRAVVLRKKEVSPP